MKLNEALERIKSADYNGDMLTVNLQDGSYFQFVGGMGANWEFDGNVMLSACIQTKIGADVCSRIFGDLLQAGRDSGGHTIFWNLNLTLNVR